jgi:hypothetical protein
MASDDPLSDPAAAAEYQQQHPDQFAESRWARPDPNTPAPSRTRTPTQAEMERPAPPQPERGKTVGSPSGQGQGWSADELDKIKASNVQPAPPMGSGGDGAYSHGVQSRMSSTIDNGGNVGALRSRMPYDNDQMRQWMPVIAVICIAVGFACAFAIFNSMQKNSNSATTVQTPAPSSNSTEKQGGTESNTSDSGDDSAKDDSEKSSPPVKRASSPSRDEQPKPKVRSKPKPRVAKPAVSRPAPKPKPKGGDSREQRFDALRNLQ